MSSDIVMLANKSYTIKQSIADRVRRRTYFLTYNGSETNASVSLNDDETRLLDDLGIDSKMITSLKFYLSTFFDNLYMCSNDSSLVLRKDCNIPYYVLWSIMVANKEGTDARIRANKEAQFVSRNIDVAMTDALLHNMEGKKITDPIDKLFQLILTTSPPISKGASNDIFKLPEDGEEDDEDDEEEDDEDDEEEVEENELIRKIFTLILTNKLTKKQEPKKPEPKKPEPKKPEPKKPEPKKPEEPEKPEPIEEDTMYDGVSATELANKLQSLFAKRRKIPLYTFSQHDTTCTTDTLFTILLQADKLRDIFIDNALVIFKDKIFWGPLVYAMRRYINMLELEASHSSDSGSRRLSVNKALIYGVIAHQNTKRMVGEYCIGATREAMLNYLEHLKKSLIDKSIIHELGTQFGFFPGSEFRTKYLPTMPNLNDIKGIYLTHPGSSSSALGHVTGFVKINEAWFFSDNEVGLLHQITDPVMIPLLFFKLSKAYVAEFKIMKMYYVRNNINYRVAANLRYQFGILLDDGSEYKYPDNPDVFKDVPVGDIEDPEVTPMRMIVITSADNDIDGMLEKAHPFFSLSPPLSDKIFIERMIAQAI